MCRVNNDQKPWEDLSPPRMTKKILKLSLAAAVTGVVVGVLVALTLKTPMGNNWHMPIYAGFGAGFGTAIGIDVIGAILLTIHKIKKDERREYKPNTATGL